MGKNFPAIFTLSEKPHLLDQTLGLIEKSFGYEGPYHFESDFAPLMNERNRKRNFILVDETDSVIAHVGVRLADLKLQHRHHALCMLGGIAVAEEHRGRGHLSTLMSHILSEYRDEVAAVLLWSNQELYRKYGFNLCGDQFESPQLPSAHTLFEKTKLAALSPSEKAQVRKLYDLSLLSEPGLLRTEEDWSEIEAISGADFYVERKSGGIESYFVVGKGMDLQGVAHEFGSLQSLRELRQRARRSARVWGPDALTEEDTLHYQFMLLPGDRRAFSELVRALTLQKIDVSKVNLVHQQVEFTFDGSPHQLPLDEFLRGVFGPQRFAELKQAKSLFIRGCDSI